MLDDGALPTTTPMGMPVAKPWVGTAIIVAYSVDIAGYFSQDCGHTGAYTKDWIRE